MSERATDARWALIIGSILAAIFSVCFLFTGRRFTIEALEQEMWVEYAGLPGIIVSVFVMGAWHGNPHGGDVKLFIATPVNLFVYSALSYLALRITSPLRRRRHRKGQ